MLKPTGRTSTILTRSPVSKNSQCSVSNATNKSCVCSCKRQLISLKTIFFLFVSQYNAHHNHCMYVTTSEGQIVSILIIVIIFSLPSSQSLSTSLSLLLSFRRHFHYSQHSFAVLDKSHLGCFAFNSLLHCFFFFG